MRKFSIKLAAEDLCNLAALNQALPVLPLLVAFYFRKYLDEGFRILAAYLILSLAFDAVLLNFPKYIWPVIHTFSIVELTIFLWMFKAWGNRQPGFLGRVWWAYVVLWILAKLFLEDFDKPDNYSASLECFIIVLLSAAEFVTLLKNEQVSLSTEPRFWVIIGLLLHFSSSTLYWALSHIIGVLVNEGAIAVFPIRLILNIINKTCFAAGFLCLGLRAPRSHNTLAGSETH